MRGLLGPVALAGLLGAAAAAAAEEPTVRSERAATYRIGAEDVLQIVVFNNEALTRVVPVRPDGMISLPLLNDVKAAGLTPLELRAQLLKRLAEYIPSPEVSVIVTAVRSFKVSVMGQVSKPGRYELGSTATVVDVLALAGGFTEFANPSRVVVLRREGPAMTRLPFNYQKVGAASETTNFPLRPGDVVLVP